MKRNVKGVEVGRPCSFTNISTGFAVKIKISSVEEHKVLAVDEYSTFFAPNCVFTKPSAGECLPEASLPLSRFMKGFNEVNLTFAAFIGPRSYYITLEDIDNKICEWKNTVLVYGSRTFCQLTYRNNKSEAWFNGIFYKQNKERNNYIFWNEEFNFTSISVDWMQTGNAPEDEICSRRTTETKLSPGHTTETKLSLGSTTDIPLYPADALENSGRSLAICVPIMVLLPLRPIC